MHSERTKQRISQGLIQAHTRLRGERGGYLTEAGLATSKRKNAARYTAELRQWYRTSLKAKLVIAHRNGVNAADNFARRFLPLVIEMQKKGMGLRAIARALNAQGYTSRQGKAWTDQTVRQLLKRRRNILAAEVLDQPRYIGWYRRR